MAFYKVSLFRLPELNASSKCSQEKEKAIRKVAPKLVGWCMSKLRRGYLESRSWIYLGMYELDLLIKGGLRGYGAGAVVDVRDRLER